MYPTLQHGFEVLLHPVPRHLHQNAHRKGGAHRSIVHIRTYHHHPAVLHAVRHHQQLAAVRLRAPQFQAHNIAANTFPHEGGAVGHRHRDVSDNDLDTTHLNGPLHQVAERHMGHHPRLHGGAGERYRRDVRGGNGREPEVGGAGRGCQLQIIHRTQHRHEGAQPVFDVGEETVVIAGLYPSEGHGHSDGEADGVGVRKNIGPEGDEARLPTQPDTTFSQLLGEGDLAGTGHVWGVRDARGVRDVRGVGGGDRLVALPALARHEDVERLLLHLAGQIHRRLHRGCSAANGHKAGDRALHELHAARPHDGVVGRTEPHVAPGRGVKPQVGQCLDHLSQPQGRHPRLQ
ncbi:MAG: hypothetical protein BWY79_01531 [Actinobacteria bacterium ADurb.Bin444]|nr:MAG: hypothetical protein BWY79_01531 [Actinobacteria bacterium ADurb.Bin444]